MIDEYVTLIDYGGSNLRSVQKAFEAVGARVNLAADPDEVRRAKKLVLPGVGAFGAGMAALRARGLDMAAAEAVEAGALLLGICLGRQFLFDESDEIGHHTGLGLIPGQVTRFAADLSDGGRPLKVPHVGWNEIDHDGTHPLLAGVAPGAHAYFVHSYYCVPRDGVDVLARADYGQPVAAVVGRDGVLGIQFHPEKSQQVGLQILRNFVNL